MSNTYFKIKSETQSKSMDGLAYYNTNSELHLTAFVGAKESPNCIQLTLDTTEDRNGKKSQTVAFITLDQEQQDMLIAGILERRHTISATGDEQSKISPAEYISSYPNKTYYLKDNEGIIRDDCQANSKEHAKNIFLTRGHKLPFGIEE